MSNMYTPPVQGLTTKEAFEKLFQEVKVTVDTYTRSKRRAWAEVLKAAFSTRSHHTTISWVSFLILICESLIILSLAIANYGTLWRSLFPEAILMFLIVIFNASLMLWENYKRLNELPVKLQKTLAKIKEMTMTWEDGNYPDLYMPYSPCISTQRCYRDRELVNLPWSLLVPGDLVVLLPGQKIIAKCHLYDDESIVLESGATFSPTGSDATSNCESEPLKLSEDEVPNLHVPMETTFAIVLEAPYNELVQMSLDTFLKRPKTFYIKERYRIINGLIECVFLPLALMIFVCLCIVRMFYLPHWLGIRVAPWTEILILQPIVNTFSLIPVALPFMFVLLHCIANAKIHTLYSVLKNSLNMKVDVDVDKESRSLTYYHVDLSIKSIYKEVWNFFKGREETLHRSQKLLHVLATVTALCCVDKKGVLSWPNPTADKIFFLKTQVNPNSRRREVKQEILDVTHDNRNAFELHFDDPAWESNMSSLKPIGLNILLNNCNYRTRATYSSFHNHITNELQTKANELVIPVVARRCLCELARIIGFTESATSVFTLEQELCSYRHIESDAICRDKLTKAKIKFPFPHMMSVVIKEKMYSTLQLMSQGTGDMILDVCDDFWDGTDLRPLNTEERKLILDFYQRSSLTSVCAAFAYKPLQAKVSQHLASLYMELPPSKGTRYLPYYAFTTGGNPHALVKDGSVSTDCIYNMAEKRRSRDKEVSDVDGCFEVQTNQIFLGMVAMQYEACMDMVQLIEQLDQACIRFVHFSKENELRSRVFSEKMGLESGWNCHISLRPLTEEEKLEEEREEREQSLFTQRSSDQPDSIHFYCTSEVDLKKHHQPVAPPSGGAGRRPTLNELFGGSSKRPSLNDSGDTEDSKFLPRCSASVPEMVMLARTRESSAEVGDREEKRRLLDVRQEGDEVDDLLDGDVDLLRGGDLDPLRGGDVDPLGAGQVLSFRTAGSGSESSLSCGSSRGGDAVSGDDGDGEDDPEVVFLPERPKASSMRKEKESLIRFADSVEESQESGEIQHGGGSTSLKVTESFTKQRNLTPTESYNDAYEMAENKTPLGYDMSNRAKLPRGIEEVRPHLENVDNVPLLVSLFTDCTAENSREMIKIMQDYGEVILLVGSVSNHENPGLFLQADASVGLEPLYPQACQKQEIFIPAKSGQTSPTEVGMMLTSLPCSLALKRSDPISFYHLIAHSRHYMNNCIRNSVQFWLCCQVSITLLGLISLIMLIPPLFTIADTMWLSCVVIPVLSLTLSFATMDTVDPEAMEVASWKNQVTLDKNIFTYVIYFYGLKFVFSLINLSLMASFNLRWICEIHLKNVNNTCSWVYPVVLSVEPKGEDKTIVAGSMKCISSWNCGDNAEKLLFVQQYSLFFLVLYFVIISASFVYRTKHIWVRSPILNKTWSLTCFSMLVIQCFYGWIRLRSSSVSFDLILGASYGWAFLWALLVLGVNEIIRRQEIKINVRFQKRARLDYGTKLGMNSPF